MSTIDSPEIITVLLRNDGLYPTPVSDGPADPRAWAIYSYLNAWDKTTYSVCYDERGEYSLQHEPSVRNLALLWKRGDGLTEAGRAMIAGPPAEPIYSLVEAGKIGETIIQQLGGRLFIAMTGASRFGVSRDGTLRFYLPIGRWRTCTVQLTPADLYTVTFSIPRGRESAMTDSAVHTDVYADSLRGIFETETGLVTKF